MTTTRRTIVTGALSAAGLGIVPCSVPRFAKAQGDDELATQRLRQDLETHASFGLKFSGGPGDHATADWTVGRLRASGYRVDVSEFDAPFFVQRASALTLGSMVVDVVPQAPVHVTGPNGVTARLAVIEDDGVVPDVSGRIAVFVAPFARHAALFPTRGIGSTVMSAAESGAIGIVVVTSGPSGEAVALNCPEDGPFVPIPMAILAPKQADDVIDAARRGIEATLVIDGDATHRPCKNVV